MPRKRARKSSNSRTDPRRDVASPGERDPRDRDPRPRPARSSPAPSRSAPALPLILGLALVLANLAIYAQTYGFSYLVFDDDVGLFKNPIVRSGLTLPGVVWAFTTFHLGNWIPLTWLSHLLDFEMFGAHPGGHHLINVLVHIASTLLLFALFLRLTGRAGPSAAIAALFSLHPLRVESVAWIIERKDVLSGLFWILTLWCYVAYAERPSSWRRYLVLVAVFAMGLLVKPMLVTLPFVLLLLDYWPLGRLDSTRAAAHERWVASVGSKSAGSVSRGSAPAESASVGSASVRSASAGSRSVGSASVGFPSLGFASLGPLVGEKMPLFALSAAASIITSIAQRRGGAILTLEQIPLGTRIANAVLAYATYVWRTIWPVGLGVYYPYEVHLPIWKVTLAGVLLVATTIACLAVARKHPYVSVGWLWYLGTLVPVIGLVQVGAMATADRYTYLPSIGLMIIAVMLPVRLAEGKPGLLRAFGVLAGVAATVLALLSWRQTRHWHDSITLFEHTLSVTGDNALAHYNLATALAQEGRIDEAITHYRETLRLVPVYVNANANLGLALFGQGKTAEAISHYEAELRRDPRHPEALCHMGVALAVQGRFPEALARFEEAVRARPDYADAHYNRGLALERLGRREEARAAYERALLLAPDNVDAEYNLAMLLAELGRVREAIDHLTRLLQVRPEYPRAREDLQALQRRLAQGS